MKREDISEVIGNISSKYILEAAPINTVSRKVTWAKWGIIAASLCIISFIAVWHTHKLPAYQEKSKYILQIYNNSERENTISEIHSISNTDTDVYISSELQDGKESPVVFIAKEFITNSVPANSANNESKDSEQNKLPSESESNSTSNENMTLAEAEKYAYMDLEGASEELRKKILKAREIIILSKSWAADGHPAYIENVLTGETSELHPNC